MADPNIQTLIYPMSVSPGIIRTYQTEVNKTTGSSVTYDVTNLGQKDAVWRSEREVAPDGKVFYRANPVRSSYYEKLSDAEKSFIQIDVAYQSDNQRAAFINKNYTQDQKNNLFPSMPKVQNTAPPDPNAGPGGTSPTPPTPPLGTTTVNLSIPDSSKVRRKYGEDLCYPVDMKKTTQDRIRFAMLRYGAQKIEGASFKLGKRTFEGGLGSVLLPIPQGITDDNGVEWGGQPLSPINAYLAGAALNVAEGKDYGESLRNELGKAAEEVKKVLLKGGAAAGSLYLAQEAVGIQGLLSRATGAIVNPNLELLFGGPALRQFNFVFKLSARDQPEAAEIRKIIRFFKQGSSVKSGAADGLFLKAPNVFDIQYKTFNGEGKMINHPSLNRIKTCALLGCSVDYTPDGSYMTYNDPARTMTSYQLTLRFTELTPVIEDDYFDTDSDFESGKLSTDTTGTTDIGF